MDSVLLAFSPEFLFSQIEELEVLLSQICYLMMVKIGIGNRWEKMTVNLW